MSAFHEPLRNKPKCRVELHIHLDGAIRYETIWELMKKKNLKLPGSGSVEDLILALSIREPVDLAHFLAPFRIFMPAFQGDLEAIERMAYEFVEDQSARSIAYCEARYCPHLLLPPAESSGQNGEVTNGHAGMKFGDSIKVDDILQATLRGLDRGMKECPGTIIKLILCCIRGLAQFSWDVLRLCEEYRDKGVVGIDIAGDEGSLGEEVNTEIEIEVFKAAKAKGIHRTAHAGEAGPASNVKDAVDVLHAERIGHGYRVVEDESVYQQCVRDRIHFECCPHSSYLTGAMSTLRTKSKRHPILRFAEDNASFSISSDDPTITNTCLIDEYKLVTSWGFTEAQITRANFEAARQSFLSEKEKQDLLKTLKEAYGVYTVFNTIDTKHSQPTPAPLNVESSTSVTTITPTHSEQISSSITEPEIPKHTENKKSMESAESKQFSSDNTDTTSEMINSETGVTKASVSTSQSSTDNTDSTISESINIYEADIPKDIEPALQNDNPATGAPTDTKPILVNLSNGNNLPANTGETNNVFTFPYEKNKEKINKSDIIPDGSISEQALGKTEPKQPERPERKLGGMEKKLVDGGKNSSTTYICGDTSHEMNGKYEDVGSQDKVHEGINGNTIVEIVVEETTHNIGKKQLQDEDFIDRKTSEKTKEVVTTVESKGSKKSTTNVNSTVEEKREVKKGVKASQLSHRPSFKISSWDDR